MRRWLWLSLSLLAAACAGPEYRIKREPRVFASFPAEAQEKVRAGHVDIGFTPEMVRLAIGPPDRKYKRRTSQGDEEVWAYTGPPEGGPGVGTGLVFGAGGGGAVGLYGIGAHVGDHGIEKRRVIFLGGKVAAIEEPMR